MAPPRVGFVTCVQLGLSCIEEIYDAGGTLDCIVTLKDTIAPRKSGRVFLDHFCHRHGVPLFKVDNINDHASVQFLERQRLDWLFIIGWSQIARPEVLRVVSRGVLGMHPTLLPRGRGRAAIPWAILKDLSETGVTLFQLDERVDAGPIMLQERVPMARDESATTLYAKITRAHRELMRAAWPLLMQNRLAGVPQNEADATFWRGRTPADGEITTAMSVDEVDRLVRATSRPYPGAFWRDGDRIVRVWSGRATQAGPTAAAFPRIACCDGMFEAVDYDIEAGAPATSNDLRSDRLSRKS